MVMKASRIDKSNVCYKKKQSRQRKKGNNHDNATININLLKSNKHKDDHPSRAEKNHKQK